MPTAAAAFHCFATYIPSSLPSNSEDKTIHLTAKPKSLLHEHPLWAPTHANISLQFKEKVLCLEIMGVDFGKALSQNPTLHSASLDSINEIVSFLVHKGIHHKDLGRVFGMCPNVLTSDIKSELNPVFNFISYDLKVPDQDLRRVINKCPRLLISSVKNQLRPALFYLQRLGFRDLQALAFQDPILLVSSVDKTLIPKLNYLMSLGFSKDDAVGMVLRCPGLFTFSIENNFKPKFEYFVKEMEGNLEELKGFPQFFAFSLEKRIKPRQLEILQRGLKVPLALMLKATDEEFAEFISEGHGI